MVVLCDNNLCSLGSGSYDSLILLNPSGSCDLGRYYITRERFCQETREKIIRPRHKKTHKDAKYFPDAS